VVALVCATVDDLGKPVPAPDAGDLVALLLADVVKPHVIGHVE
jgi:hypothetical protein